ncbi:MAG: hypothetical protein IJK28_10570 [Clostridia bacterium]|nr:hypothetical protein [Clostridia bacterium]
MIEQFKLGLLRGTEPAAVAKELKERLRREIEQREREIDEDKKRADFIALGMREPKGTEPRTIADSYLRQYEQDTGEKISVYRDGEIAEMLRNNLEEGSEDE